MNLHYLIETSEPEVPHQPADQVPIDGLLKIACRQHVRAKLLVESLESRCQVHALADGGVIKMRRTANISDAHRPGVQSHTRAQRQIRARGIELKQFFI